MFESGLLLNVMPAFYGNRFNFTIRFYFVTKSVFSVLELNFSQDFTDERRGIASLRVFGLKSRLC